MESYYAKQPIFDLNNNIVAYELLYRKTSVPAPYAESNGDMSTAKVIVNTFFGNDLLHCFDNKKIFINFTENLILNKTAYLLPKETVIVEILETVPATKEVLAACHRLKADNFVIALDDYIYSDSSAPFISVADIVKIDFLNTKKEDILLTANICRKNNVTILAEKIETKETLDLAHSLGAKYVQGYYFAKPIIVKNNNALPLKKTFDKLMEIYNDSSFNINSVSEIIEQDAAMTVNLLRYVNSSSNTSDKISSVNQAVNIIGLERSKEFIYLMNLQQLNSDLPENLVMLAFFRARFCESLGKWVGSSKVDKKELYLMGLVSIISDSEMYSRDSIANNLPISDNIKHGLAGKKHSIYADIFKLVISYEKAEWEEIEHFNNKYGTTDELLAQDYVNCLKDSENFMDSCLYM